MIQSATLGDDQPRADGQTFLELYAAPQSDVRGSWWHDFLDAAHMLRTQSMFSFAACELLEHLVGKTVELFEEHAQWPAKLNKWSPWVAQLAFLHVFSLYKNGGKQEATAMVYRIVTQVGDEFVVEARPNDQLLFDFETRCFLRAMVQAHLGNHVAVRAG